VRRIQGKGTRAIFPITRRQFVFEPLEELGNRNTRRYILKHLEELGIGKLRLE
ncbi:hypothetical protein ILYODFUR_025916, partial [Ilyodon furcidens]